MGNIHVEYKQNISIIHVRPLFLRMLLQSQLHTPVNEQICRSGLHTQSPRSKWTHDAVLRPIHRGMLRFTGWEVLAPNIVYGPVRLSEDERLASLNAWAARLLAVEKEKPIAVGEY